MGTGGVHLLLGRTNHRQHPVGSGGSGRTVSTRPSGFTFAAPAYLGNCTPRHHFISAFQRLLPPCGGASDERWHELSGDPGVSALVVGPLLFPNSRAPCQPAAKTSEPNLAHHLVITRPSCGAPHGKTSLAKLLRWPKSVALSAPRCCPGAIGAWGTSGAPSAPKLTKSEQSRPNHLRPNALFLLDFLVPTIRIERMTSRLQGGCSTS